MLDKLFQITQNDYRHYCIIRLTLLWVEHLKDVSTVADPDPRIHLQKLRIRLRLRIRA
jgi:hypothetical protein